MKICVFGLWHLGSVTAACLAGAGFDTVGLDDDAAVIENLACGRPPLFEPGLSELICSGLESGHLAFTTDRSVVRGADVVWVTFDTPVDGDDRADVPYVLDKICDIFPFLRDNAIVLVSSQLPVGSIARIEKMFEVLANGRHVSFVCSPENLRLGKAINVFRNPGRVIVGSRNEAVRSVISRLFAPFSDNIIWVGTEAAEMTKHAINAFLATCVVFANEIASVSEKVGADAREVEIAMRSEPRIGENAYIRPGGAFAGGTLARDVTFLSELAIQYRLPLYMIGNILTSNTAHGDWPLRRLEDLFGALLRRKIAILGLSYKPGTDALRRSLSVALIRKLCVAGASVSAFDPAVRSLPDAPTGFHLAGSCKEALDGAEAAIVMTEWPDFRDLSAADFVEWMASPNVLDQNRFLSHLAADPRIRYDSIGRTT